MGWGTVLMLERRCLVWAAPPREKSHSRGWGKAGAPLGHTEPKHRHSALQVNYTQCAANFNPAQSGRLVFSQHKVGCRGLQRTTETGEWEIVFIRSKQGKQENKTQVPGEWGCLKQATFILTPFCYINIRVYLGFSLLLTQRARHSTSVVALGDKLPAKTHSATRWRARSNDDFPPARCRQAQLSPGVLTHAIPAGQLPVLGCPTALMTRFIFQMALQLISYLQVTTLFTVLYHRENYIHWSIFIMHKIGQYINMHTDTCVGTCISKQIFP